MKQKKIDILRGELKGLDYELQHLRERHAEDTERIERLEVERSVIEAQINDIQYGLEGTGLSIPRQLGLPLNE